jgi:hypothetical protein
MMRDSDFSWFGYSLHGMADKRNASRVQPHLMAIGPAGRIPGQGRGIRTKEGVQHVKTTLV